MQQPREAHLQNKRAQLIRYEPQSQVHIPCRKIIELFESSVNEELRIGRMVARDWLRVGTWWLLKARTALANCGRNSHGSARGNINTPSESDSTSAIYHQAYADILKASYILYSIVLKKENPELIFTDQNCKSIAELSESINIALNNYFMLEVPGMETTLSQNCAIWEALQPAGTPGSGLAFSSGIENARWISVHQEDAGSEDEKVLYRTFVNAGIGSKNFRIRTKGAPYMLLLAAQEGEIEPKTILCNQSGSLCLCRTFVPDDLPPMIQLANVTMAKFPRARISEPLSFKFDKMDVSVSFRFVRDLQQFIKIPKLYFDAVWLREPIHSKEFTESVIFKGSVKMLEQLKTPTMRSLNPPMVLRSCEIRVLERAYDEAWRSTRRTVITPSVTQPMPRCLEYFMPLDAVQISREKRSRQFLLKWSDVCQERSDKKK